MPFCFDGTEEGFIFSAMDAGLRISDSGWDGGNFAYLNDPKTLIRVYWDDGLKKYRAFGVVSRQPLQEILMETQSFIATKSET